MFIFILLFKYFAITWVEIFKLLAIEIFNIKSLKKAKRESKTQYEKEHVTPYIIKSKKFKKIRKTIQHFSPAALNYRGKKFEKHLKKKK